MKKKFEIRELPKIDESVGGVLNYYEPGYNEPLLEYVKILMHKYVPVSSLTEDYGCFTDRGMGRFAERYFDNEIDRSALGKYLDSDKLSETIIAFGYDIEKFWYLLLFVNDYSYGLTKEGYKQGKSRKAIIKEFADKIIDNLRRTDNGTEDQSFRFVDSMEIILKTKGKHKFVINDPFTIGFIAACCGAELKNIHDHSGLNQAIPKKRDHDNLFDESPLSTYVWYFSNMFISFFKLVPPKSKTRKENGIYYNKLLLISKLLYTMGLYYNKNLLSSDDTIKGYLQQYRGSDMNICNLHYI